MSEAAASDTTVTTWLHRLRDGDPQALARVLPLVCDELRALARSQLRNGRSAHTLNATALVHEAFLRLNQREQLEPADRRHFFAIAAQAMRRVLIDHARSRNRIKRGGGQRAITLDEGAFLTDEAGEELVALDQALERLVAANERAARVVEQRFFAGLTLEETAAVLGVSLKTVQRDWILARAWLRKEIAGDSTLLEPPAPPAQARQANSLRLPRLDDPV